MDEGQGVRYWCHSCEEVIDPTMPELKFPGCDGGFVEEMDSEYFEPAVNTRSDRSLLNLAPLLLGMLGGSMRRSRLRREVMNDDDDDSDRELEEFIQRRRRRRRRGYSTLVTLLQTLRDDKGDWMATTAIGRQNEGRGNRRGNRRGRGIEGERELKA
jgi:E3 ubiquitin-protein ligase RNF115/126